MKKIAPIIAILLTSLLGLSFIGIAYGQSGNINPLGARPCGSNTYIQFYAYNLLGCDSGFTFASTTSTLLVNQSYPGFSGIGNISTGFTYGPGAAFDGNIVANNTTWGATVYPYKIINGLKYFGFPFGGGSGLSATDDNSGRNLIVSWTWGSTYTNVSGYRVILRAGAYSNNDHYYDTSSTTITLGQVGTGIENSLILGSTVTPTIPFLGNGKIGIGTSTPSSPISIGTSTNYSVMIDPYATSTYGQGINIVNGCFALNGSCVSGGTGGSTSVIGIIRDQHVDGTWTSYDATTSSDLGRGTALATAVSNASNGDVLYVASTTFDGAGNTFTVGAKNISIVGAGMFSTNIKSSNSTIINVDGTTGLTLKDFMITGTTNGVQFPISQQSGNVNNLNIQNVYVNNPSDGLYISAVGNYSTTTVQNFRCNSKWDCVYYLAKGGEMRVYNSVVTSAADASINSSLNAHGFVEGPNNKADMYIYNSKALATGGTETAGIYNGSPATGGKIYTFNTDSSAFASSSSGVGRAIYGVNGAQIYVDGGYLHSSGKSNSFDLAGGLNNSVHVTSHTIYTAASSSLTTIDYMDWPEMDLAFAYNPYFRVGPTAARGILDLNAVPAVTGSTIVTSGGGNFNNVNGFNISFNVYAYYTKNGITYYTPAQNVTYSESGVSGAYFATVSWSPVFLATGYKVVTSGLSGYASIDGHSTTTTQTSVTPGDGTESSWTTNLTVTPAVPGANVVVDAWNGYTGIGTSSPVSSFAVAATSTLMKVNPYTFVNTVIAVESDSLSVGYHCTFSGGTSPCAWPDYFTGNSSSTDRVSGYIFGNGKYGTMLYRNFGVIGEETPTAIALYNSKAHLIAPTGVNQSGYYFVQMCTNDVNNGRSAADCYTNLKSLWASGRADGYKVVAFTVPPLLGSNDLTNTSGSESHPDQRRLLNQLLMSTEAKNLYDYIIPLDRLMPDSTDLRYYLADQIHFTATANLLIANAVTRALSPETANLYVANDVNASSSVSGMNLILNKGGNDVIIGTSTGNTAFGNKLTVYGGVEFNFSSTTNAVTHQDKLTLTSNIPNPSSYIQTTNGNLFLMNNVYYDANSGGFRSGDGIGSGYASSFFQIESGTGGFYYATMPASTPGSTLTPSYRVRVLNNGFFALCSAPVDCTSPFDPSYPLDVKGSGHFTDVVDATRFNATTTTATSTFAGRLQVNDFASTSQLSISSSATSTFTAGVNIKIGCFAINNVCQAGGGGGGSGTVTSVATNNGLTGGTITTSGTLGLDTSQLSSNMLTVWTGSVLAASSTPSVTAILATSTAATSTIQGGLNVGNGNLVYDRNSGTTTISNLVMGTMLFDLNPGVVSWVNLPMTSAAPSGTAESYSALMNGSTTLTIYGQADGSGFVKTNTLGVGVASSTPSGLFAVGSQGTATTTIFFDSSSAKGTCLVMRDVGGTGVTYITTKAGALTASTVSCQ